MAAANDRAPSYAQADDEALSLAKMRVLEKRHPWTNKA
jgi:hypothetical protein